MVAAVPNCRRIRAMRVTGLVLVALVTVSSPLLAQLAISNTSLPFGGVGQDYVAPITATGGSGDYGFSVTPSQPAPGLFFNGDLHRIEGTPTTPGAFSVTVKVTDTQTSNTVSKQFTIDVMQISTPPTLPGGSTCSFYSQTFAVSDGPPPPFNWSFSDSSPPPGLILSAQTGVLSGTPTAGGPFSFTIEALSQTYNVFAVQTFSLTVSSLCLLQTTLPNGDLNSLYRESLVVTGGAAPFTGAVKGGDLPTGVTIDPKSGLLEGTPTVAGSFNFTIEVIDSNSAVATQSFTLTIRPALAFTTTSPLPGSTAGVTYSQTFAATGGMAPYVFTTPDPPPGLLLNSAGVLSGSPSVGSFTMTVTVTDSLNIAISMNFTVTFISAGPLLQVSPTALTFSAVFQGDAPATPASLV